MGTCSTCAHWLPLDALTGSASDAIGGYASFAQGATKRKLGLCQAIRDEDHNLDEQEAAGVGLAQATDLSRFAALRTAASFGCVLHVAKGSA